MKRTALLIGVLIFLAAGTALAGPGGVWKNQNGTTSYSWYVQTYAGGAMLVMLTADAGAFCVFMDTENAGYFHADHDLAGNAHKLTISFYDNDTAVAILLLEGMVEPDILTLARNSIAPALDEDPGDEDPGDEDPGDEDPGGEDPGNGTNGNPPTGSLIIPPDGSVVIGLTGVAGRTYDDVGVKRVGIRIGGGSEVDASLNVLTGTFEYLWDSTTAAKGPVSIVATSYDTEGLSSVIGTLNVTVNNTTGPMANQVQPISPANGAVNLSVPLKMTWNPVDDVVGYRIQVAGNLAFASPLLVDQDISGTSFSFNQASSGTLYWRVRGNYSSNHFAPWSYTWSFTISGSGQ